MPDVKEDLQRYVDAVKLDMLDLFNKPTLNVFEFRRLAELCDIMIPLCNSAAGGRITHQVIADAMWGAESRAPTLHQALGGHIFDADELLQEKYRAMSEMHHDLRAKLAMAKKAEYTYEVATRALSAQIEGMTEIEAGLAAERKLLTMRGEELAQRELALTSGDSAKQLSSGETKTVEVPEVPEAPQDPRDDQQGE